MAEPARERDTIPSLRFEELEAPRWAQGLAAEVREMRTAMGVTNELLLGHTQEMARLSDELRRHREELTRVRLTQITYEHRYHKLEQRVGDVETIVSALELPAARGAANG